MKLNSDIKRFTWLRFFKFENINKFNLIDCTLFFLHYKWRYLHIVILQIKTYEILKISWYIYIYIFVIVIHIFLSS